MPPEDVAQIESTAKRIINSDETFYEMSIMMRQSDMIEAVRAGVAMQAGDTEAWVTGVSILMALLTTMAEALNADNIDIWED